ncbi:MAG: hypothetical protein IKM49_03710 [Ruminococcus sp.]|nr:hypothetical protein [Ruminococcus sp.]
MKKITGIFLVLSMLVMSVGCGDNSSEKEKSSAEEDIKTTSVSEETEAVSETEATSSTEEKEETTTEENTTEAPEVQKETEFLKLNEKYLSDYALSEEYGVNLAEFECSSVLLEKDEAKRYPELAESLSSACDMYEVNMLESHDMFISDAKEMLSAGEQGFDTLVSTLDVHVRRADNTVLSILYDSFYYNGMNDGIRSFWGGNYDTETGEEIYLPDVVTDMEEFASVVEAQLFDEIGADVFYSDTIIREYFNDYGADGTHWTIEYNGITVYFDEGEIAGSGVGAMSVTVEFAEYPELFKEKYTAVPEAYIVGIPMKSPFRTDLDGDGSSDELFLSDSYDEEFAWNATLTIATEEVDYNESFVAYGCEAYYVKTADDRNYLYVLVECESQTELYTYAITNTTISKVGEQPISPYYSDQTVSVLTDPDNMHFDIFGNADVEPVGDDFFTVGYDGMPVMK